MIRSAHPHDSGQPGFEPNGMNLAFIEGLYAQYWADRQSVSEDWRAYFDKLGTPEPAATMGPRLKPGTLFNPRSAGQSATVMEAREGQVAALQDRVDQLIRAYRVRGHLIARIDPLGIPKPSLPEIEPANFGLTENDLDRSFSSNTIQGPEVSTLREMLRRLQDTYCRSIGVQFMHIDDPEVRKWLQERMEGCENRIHLSRRQQIDILTRLTDAVLLEEFIQKKYLGAKSFSLEGSESLIPLLSLALEMAGEQEIDDVVLAMAHRGRLNVLVNIMGKSPRDVFHEFEDPDPELHLGRGDVKYHLGYTNNWEAANGHKIHLSLCFNPSHLEYVNPVAQGRLRAKQDRVNDSRRVKGMCLLIHGDAAFAGEGVMQEILNMSELPGYTTGGTLHVIVNNQIGFTTGPDEARSTTYASDVAKMLQIPIFHVNGEDPEAVAQVVRLAMDFRMTFKRDVVIDMYGYRRRGHNEGDEPAFTQPVLYRTIRQRKSVREGYLEHLLKLGGVTREEADKIAAKRTEQLEEALTLARQKQFKRSKEGPSRVWKGFQGGPEPSVADVDTGMPLEKLADLMERLTTLPHTFQPHPKVLKLLETRAEMGKGLRPLDWATAESLAFASLAAEGVRIRLSGQDSARGTFSQRHAVLYDIEDGHAHTPLQNLSPEQAAVEIVNSPLTETGILGFEYGYSHDCPGGLILWEAQFGDFINAAQVIVDQFIASAEDKWKRLSGLVLLLPHGFEGMGPEHSSARLERFLTLAADDNIQVLNPTTPAQYFHSLRRQVLRPWRKPLIMMTPKSLLRHARATSTLEDLTQGTFKRILPDVRVAAKRSTERILLCSGKIYYELEEERENSGREDIAILRLEQIYPLYNNFLEEALAPYASGTPVVWVQEEPENMGAWRYLRIRLGESILGRHPFSGIYRAASSSPATGSANSHRLEQRQLLADAFEEDSLHVSAKILQRRKAVS